MNCRYSQWYFLRSSCCTITCLLMIPFIVGALERKKPRVNSLGDIIALNKEAIPNLNIKKSGFGIVSRWRRGMQELYEKDAPQTGDNVIQLYQNSPHSLVTVGHKTFIHWRYADKEHKTWIIEQDEANTYDADDKQIYRIDNRYRSILNSYPDNEIVERAMSQLSATPKRIEKDDSCEDFFAWCVFGVDKGVAGFVYLEELRKIYENSQKPKIDIHMRIRVINGRGEAYTNPTVDILNILGESLASDKTTKNEKEKLGVKPYKIDISYIWKMVGFGMLQVFGSVLKPGGDKRFMANTKEMVQVKRTLETYNSGIIYNEGTMETRKDKGSGKKVQTGVFVAKVHTWAGGDIWICVAPSHKREALMTYHMRIEDYLRRQRSKSNVTLVLNANTAQDVSYE